MKKLFVRRAVAIGIVFIIFGVGLYIFLRPQKKPLPIVSVINKVENIGAVHTVIGQSIEKRNIDAYTYGTGKTHIAFVGGVHGGYEWNSVVLAYKFLDYLDANPGVVPTGLTVTVIPSANPDGLYKVVGKEGRFTVADVSTNKQVLASGRFNAHDVDLNRNFDCKWQPKSTWQTKIVSAGTKPFSEPEAVAIRDFALKDNPAVVVFWHSQSGNVYASQCEKGILPETINTMNVYAKASGYGAVKTFDAYVTTGDSEAWLASVGIPAITVELKTHETVEWEQNLAGVKALFEYYNQKKD